MKGTAAAPRAGLGESTESAAYLHGSPLQLRFLRRQLHGRPHFTHYTVGGTSRNPPKVRQSEAPQNDSLSNPPAAQGTETPARRPTQNPLPECPDETLVGSLRVRQFSLWSGRGRAFARAAILRGRSLAVSKVTGRRPRWWIERV